MGNVKYRTDFIFKCLVNIGMFIYFFAFSRDPIVLILIIMNTYYDYVWSAGVKIHKENGWNKVYRKHDQRTHANTHFAGYISMWFMMAALILGGLSLRYELLPIDSFELIYGILLGGLVVMLFIRHYLNGDDFQ